MTDKEFSSNVGTAIYKDGIMTVRYHKQGFTLEEAKTWVDDIEREFEAVLPVLMIINISAQKDFQKDVRDYMNTPRVMAIMKAAAMVADSIMTRIIGNIFMTLSKPPMPAKLFADEASATVWLQQFVEKK